MYNGTAYSNSVYYTLSNVFSILAYHDNMSKVQDWLFIHLYFFHVIQCIICTGSVLILLRIDIVIFLVFLYNINNTSIIFYLI